MISNRAWPWIVEKDGGVYLVWRWYRDPDVLIFKNECEAQKCADDLNFKDYGNSATLTAESWIDEWTANSVRAQVKERVTPKSLTTVEDIFSVFDL